MTALGEDARTPYSETAPGLANTAAALTARRQATAVATLAAIVPTVLAMQGMASLASDVLGFALPVAIALAGFLELALISSALLARASALAGRPGGVDGLAVWVVSFTSGALAATHEFVGPEVGGVRGWEVDPGSILAAGVRIVAPLVAAWLWERVLTAARREHAERTLVEVRRDRRLLSVAREALAVRRLEADHGEQPTPWQASRMRAARRRLDRSHVAALRTGTAGTDELPIWLTTVGSVDGLPAATIVGRLGVWPTVSRGPDHEPNKSLTGPQRGPNPIQLAHRESEPGPRPGSSDHLWEQGADQSLTEPWSGPTLNQAGPVVGHAGPPIADQMADQSHTGPWSSPTSMRTEPAVGHASQSREASQRPIELWSRPAPDHTEPPVETPTGRTPVVAAAEAALRAANVNDLRDQGLSQREIGIELGMSKSTVGRVPARNSTTE